MPFHRILYNNLYGTYNANAPFYRTVSVYVWGDHAPRTTAGIGRHDEMIVVAMYLYRLLLPQFLRCRGCESLCVSSNRATKCIANVDSMVCMKNGEIRGPDCFLLFFHHFRCVSATSINQNENEHSTRAQCSIFTNRQQNFGTPKLSCLSHRALQVKTG